MDNKQVAVINNEKSALVPMEFTSDQVDLIKTTVAKGTSNNQLALFLYTCKKTGLDPLVKQIHCVVRNTKNGPVMSIQTAIDGYRLIADRSGKYAGNDDPIYDDEKNPKKATVTVYKLVNGIRCAFTATARWDQYYPGDAQGFMWKKMPHLMLGKCGEALALRKAFPAELSGLYTNEEMSQADASVTTAVTPVHHDLDRAIEGEVVEHHETPKQVPPTAPKTEPIDDKAYINDMPKELPKTPPETEQEFISGIVGKYWPPTGKGPHKCSIDKVYYSTFDHAIGAELAENEGKCIQFKYSKIVNGKYTNNIIDEIVKES